ncbi:30S ribosomal protein S4 [Clostridioides difficile]|uniref:30S ribosomal protein S4 n=1 Tax=Clostridioides difficile TaxID=1496 RepID=UPI001C1438F9|nr:30S ribosomal protein S4 [Clostridioides difficile]KAK2240002.1 30S ribosomal protein S4 [Clostridioides difficile]MCM4102481.1 30S ribosomal protein S4 [Clostridioides difficile]MDI6221511.1 30S ribosomal protein S4 [Clostridioides difficile]MDM9960217.1 30S ribosomal protein S4 [Clostridioides difficile]MDN9160194.1 30S ribosomal protein S4 [Clostridioides difficile]
MARYTGASCRQCRREGMKLFLKGDRCYTDKCAIVKRNYAPGQHGQGRKKVSNYGLQLREKQKVKRIYGVLETQFRNLYERAENMPGKAGENLLSLLERRLDNVVYRMGLASSRKEARQLVTHGHFTLNGNKVDIPSLIVKVGDVIEVKEKSRSSAKFKNLVEVNSRIAPKWLEVNVEGMTAKVVGVPTREDIDLEIAEHLIIELYSK